MILLAGNPKIYVLAAYFLYDDNITSDTDDDNEDGDEDMGLIDRKRGRRESKVNLRKAEKDEAGAKSKKRPKVLIEVKLKKLLSHL